MGYQSLCLQDGESYYLSCFQYILNHPLVCIPVLGSNLLITQLLKATVVSLPGKSQLT